MKSKLKPAYGYPRVSSPIQEQNGYGLDRQKTDISQFAKKNGYRIVKHWDELHTGTEVKRPEFVAMVQAMMNSKIKVVIVESLDRFSRDLMIQMTLLARLAAEGITLFAANTGENVTQAMEADPMRRALVQVQGIFAELDRGQLMKRFNCGKRDKKRAAAKVGLKAKLVGAYAYGEHPRLLKEVPVLTYIRQLRRKPVKGKRLSCGAIATILNAEGFLTRYEHSWKRQQVWLICKRKGWV